MFLKAWAAAAAMLLVPVPMLPVHAEEPEPPAAEIKCLALSVYHEARGEPLDGMVAVALAVMHRVGHQDFPGTVCGVVQQKSSAKECQFPWACGGAVASPHEEQSWLISRAVARAVYQKEVPDIIEEARFFTNCAVTSPWIRRMTLVTRIGDHCFYRDPGLRDEEFVQSRYVEYADKYDFVLVSSREDPKSPDDLRLVPVPFVDPDKAKQNQIAAERKCEELKAASPADERTFFESVWHAFSLDPDASCVRPGKDNSAGGHSGRRGQ